MADSLHVPGRPRRAVLPKGHPTPAPITPEKARIALFALALTRSVGECDPYFCDGGDAGRFKCFFCGERDGTPHLPTCGHATARRLVQTGALEDGP